MMKFANEKDIYIPIQRKVKNVKLADVIKTSKPHSIFDNIGNIIYEEYVISNVYDYYVIGTTKNGEKRCFTIGDLVVLGLESSLPTR